MPDERFKINLKVADKYYPLTIKRSEEGKIRQAAKLINEKVERYKHGFSAGEKADYIAMAAIQLVTQLVELQEYNNVDPIMDTLQELEDEIDTVLQNPAE